MIKLSYKANCDNYCIQAVEVLGMIHLYKRIRIQFYISCKINYSQSLGDTSKAAVAMVIDVVWRCRLPKQSQPIIFKLHLPQTKYLSFVVFGFFSFFFTNCIIPDPIIVVVFIGLEYKSCCLDPMVSLSEQNLEHEPMII